MRLASPENYAVGGIVNVTAHEALEELARRVYDAFRCAISNTAFSNDTEERDRALYGPWHGHEVRGAAPELVEKHGELLAAFASTAFQKHIANLERESARLIAGAGNAPKGPSGNKEFDELTPLYKAIRDLKLRLATEGKIIAYLATPEGKGIRELIELELRRSPTTRSKTNPRKRTPKDVLRAALKHTYQPSP